MPMKMYVFDDSKVADKLRSLGFSVIQNGRGGRCKYCVPEDSRLTAILSSQFADAHFAITDVLCF